MCGKRNYLSYKYILDFNLSSELSAVALWFRVKPGRIIQNNAKSLRRLHKKIHY